jgi:hypothetical protein
MDDASNTFRLAIGVFYELPRLEGAIADLRADGVGTTQMCLTGTRPSIDALGHARGLPPATAGNAAASLTGQLQALMPLASELELFATNGQLLDALLEHTRADENSHAAARHWLLPDLFAGLTTHLQAGAVALLVSAPEIGLQRRSSRILLRHSAHTVQTHEFAPRPAAGR